MYIDNPNLDDSKEDTLYHFGISTRTHDFVKFFGDIKFVCCGGSAKRMEKMANMILRAFHYTRSIQPVNISQKDRFVMYKVGCVLCISHGIGMASLSVMLHELFKLLHHAKCTDVLLFRIGTSGGLGIPPGTIVLTDRPYTALLEPDICKTESFGEAVSIPAVLDQTLADELCTEAELLNMPTVKGNTVGTNDFYQAQGRLDGALCDYDRTKRIAFLKKAKEHGVVNFEMEGPLFAAMTLKVGIKAALMCVTLVDRMEGDQVSLSHADIENYEDRPCRVLLEFIKKRIAKKSQF